MKRLTLQLQDPVTGIETEPQASIQPTLLINISILRGLDFYRDKIDQVFGIKIILTIVLQIFSAESTHTIKIQAISANLGSHRLDILPQSHSMIKLCQKSLKAQELLPH